jgi:hypothetical protein
METACREAALALLALFCWPLGHALADQRAVEILAASKAAMSKPLKYRVAAGGVEMTVYQKELPNGRLASLSETAMPAKKLNITYDDKCYEVYLEQRIAIDMQHILGAARTQAATIASQLGPKAAESPRITKEVTRNGKSCFEIESMVSPDVVAALAKSLSSREAAPAAFRYTIEKDTYFMVEMMVMSRDGSLLSKTEVKDVRAQPGLSDEFFQLPSGLEVRQPKSLAEYFDVIRSISKEPAPPAVAPPKHIPMPDHTPATTSGGAPKNRLRTYALIAFNLALCGVFGVVLFRRSRRSG